MSSINDQINTLNSLLQGTYLGIDGYSKCINKIKNESIRHMLEHQELEQREIVMELASRIRDLGGTPKENAGPKGTMASFMSTLKLAEENDTKDVLVVLQDGVKMGIESNEKAIPELDDDISMKLIHKHLNEDKKAYDEIRNIKSTVYNNHINNRS